MNMGGEMKSTKGYGATRTSGMGLQDENLIPGKSMDYYKDLIMNYGYFRNYRFDLQIDDIIEEAYERCGLRTNSGHDLKSA